MAVDHNLGNQPQSLTTLTRSMGTYLESKGIKPLTPEEFQRQIAEIDRKEREKAAQERAENRQKAAAAMLGRAAIPIRYAEASLDREAPNQSDAYQIARDYAAAFPNALRTGAGLLLWGSVGTGKTHLACAIGNYLLARMCPVVYCTAMEAVLTVRATFGRKGEGDSEFQVYERFALPKLLILDEIGVQRGTDDERVVLTSIADARSRQCLPTIVISNLEPRDVCRVLGDRAFDRLVGFGGKIVPMAGRSLRFGGV